LPSPSRETTIPNITSVTSSTVNASYKAGDVISIQVAFSQLGTVTGTPELRLKTGGTDRVVNYTSGNPSTTLTFNYTVQAGDTSGDLDYTSTNAPTLKGGTIVATTGGAADLLTLEAPGTTGSLGANKAIVFDAVVPRRGLLLPPPSPPPSRQHRHCHRPRVCTGHDQPLRPGGCGCLFRPRGQRQDRRHGFCAGGPLAIQVRQRHLWTEWEAVQDDGQTAFPSEDNGAYVYARPLAVARALPETKHLRLGATTAIDGRTYAVTTNSTVQLLAAQGELPHLPPLGTPFDMVELCSQGDAADGQALGVLTLDYSNTLSGQPVAVSLGSTVLLEELQMVGIKVESTQDEKGHQFSCTACRAPVQVDFGWSPGVESGQTHHRRACVGQRGPERHLDRRKRPTKSAGRRATNSVPNWWPVPLA